MNAAEVELRNRLSGILDQIEQMSQEDQEQFWNECPEQHRAILRTLQDERRMLKAIGESFAQHVTTETGEPIPGIRFEADPTGGPDEDGNMPDPSRDWGFDFRTNRYTGADDSE